MVHYKENIKAFTLVELSIVIVIIGLIIAGVSAGQSIVASARLRSFWAEFSSYKTAITTYKFQYDYLPGDHSNATGFFSSCVSNAEGSCDGNGNGLLELPREQYRFWQHLSLANLVPGGYTGLYGGAWTPGVNIPNSAYKGFPFVPRYQGNIYRIPLPAKSHFHYASYASASPGFKGALTAIQAYDLDMKFDDGLADKNLVQAENDFSGLACVSDSYTNPRNYTSITNAKCRMFLFF